MQVLPKPAKPSSIFDWNNHDTLASLMFDFSSIHMRVPPARVFMECEDSWQICCNCRLVIEDTV